MKKALIILTSIIGCLLIGFIGSRFQTEAIEEWYPTLNKPSLTPPNFVFPIAWTLLYICMGLSIGLVICSNTAKKSASVTLYLIQLLLNFTWSISFFYMENPTWGLINIVLLDLFVIAYAIYVYPIRKISSLLFVPYILWIAFATYLNLYIVLNN